MSYLKRAGLYCLRQRFKTFILFFVLTLIAAFILNGIASQRAFIRQASSVQTTVGGKILLEIDMEGHMGGGQENEWGKF